MSYSISTNEARALLAKALSLPMCKRSNNAVRGYIREIVWAECEPKPYGECEAHIRESRAYIEQAKKIIAKARAL